MQRWKLLICVVAMIIVGYSVYPRRSQSITAPPTPPPDPNAFMAEMAEGAVEYALGRGKTLDYSPESVQVVESLLGELHEARAKQQLSDRDVDVHAVQFGAYVGEVLRRKYNGSWQSDHPVPGIKSSPIHWNGGESFPIGWCGRRILDGEEDNVWVKYQILTSDEYGRVRATQATSEPAKAE